jgi:hypothetical protein
VGHVAYMEEMISAYKMLDGKHEARRPFLKTQMRG